jgi:threonine/homoserine/homoserine lactone efflux protein
VWALATSVGLATLIVAFEPAFVALKLAGAAFLVYLGVHALLRAFRGGPAEARSSRRSSPFRQGLISNLGNPKMAVFFTSLLPQFAETLSALLGLGLLFCSMTFVWLSAYALAVAKAGDVLRRPAIRRAFDAVLGAVLVALGIRLATDRR